MNPNSGGPHILLFERDQQLTSLLTSEFQLAGYDCHPARTAVEVFDAIARRPIRLVLVNLAQPAASRREFWVALDTQRRGRGVQVLTFRCINIAGYGSDDSDDSSRTVLTDIEVDGMMGIMHLVDAVRTRIPGPIIGSFSQIAKDAYNEDAGMQATSTISTRATNPSLTAAPTANPAPTGASRPQGPTRTVHPASGFTDKIRAVIYPSSRNYSPTAETHRVLNNPQNTVSTPQANGTPSSTLKPQEKENSTDNATQYFNTEVRAQRQAPRKQTTSVTDSTRITDRPVQESGLAQLSRMVHESLLTETEDATETGIPKQPTSPLEDHIDRQAKVPASQTPENAVDTPTHNSSLQQPQAGDTHTISELPLRAAPIEETPIKREQEYRSSYVGLQSLQPEQYVAEIATVSTPPVVSAPEMKASALQEELSSTMAPLPDVGEESPATRAEEVEAIASSSEETASVSSTLTQNQSLAAEGTTDDTLLDIVQSLPPMSPLPKLQPQAGPPVLSGRATRTLGSVLLEGHLVPQHRLEVAQHIQRMLRGVDMNYQLGEILLMFKLLTPDQLLAASLVSYGLISTAQISALGRIRQELHAIGLEYDLESLLVLFRILTPEQLREVRASWIG